MSSNRNKLTDEFVNNYINENLPEYSILQIIREKWQPLRVILKCDKGHIVKNTFNNIANKGQRCGRCSGNYSFTTEEIRKYIEEEIINWKQLKLISEYKNNRTPISLLDNEGYKYYVRLDNLQTAYNKNYSLEKFHKSNIYTIENIHTYLKNNNIKDQLLSTDYHGNDKYLDWLCPEGHEYKMIWGNFSQGKRCGFCCINKKKTFEFIKEQFDNRGYVLLSTEYLSNTSNLDFICNNHKEFGIQQTTWATMQAGNGCKYCHYDNMRESRKMGIEEYKQRVFDLVGDEYTILEDNYINNSVKLNTRHNICNYEYPVAPANFLNGHRCPKCNQPKGEVKISSIFDANLISYNPQYTFPDCKYKQLLIFDFYLHNYNTCIEYQGIQHYEPVDFAGKGQEWAEKQFILNQKRDQIKRDYCNKNNIKLIEIPYWDSDKIEEILIKELKLNTYKNIS